MASTSFEVSTQTSIFCEVKYYWALVFLVFMWGKLYTELAFGVRVSEEK